MKTIWSFKSTSRKWGGLRSRTSTQRIFMAGEAEVRYWLERWESASDSRSLAETLKAARRSGTGGACGVVWAPPAWLCSWAGCRGCRCAEPPLPGCGALSSPPRCSHRRAGQRYQCLHTRASSTQLGQLRVENTNSSTRLEQPAPAPGPSQRPPACSQLARSPGPGAGIPSFHHQPSARRPPPPPLPRLCSRGQASQDRSSSLTALSQPASNLRALPGASTRPASLRAGRWPTPGDPRPSPRLARSRNRPTGTALRGAPVARPCGLRARSKDTPSSRGSSADVTIWLRRLPPYARWDLGARR